MPEPNAPFSFFLKFAVVVSVFGLVSILLLLSQSGNYQIDFWFSNLLIGSLFAGICIVGISAVFYPNKCERAFMFRKQSGLPGQDDSVVLAGKIGFSGHHPDCEAFSGNRITVQKVVLCAACTGLLFGAVVALIGTLFYFFLGFVPFPATTLTFIAGYGGMLLGLVQFKFRGWLKAMVNALFVLGSFIVLVAADVLGRNYLIDLYVIGLILFFLLTRILFSEWNNKRICYTCEGCKWRD